MAIPEFTGDEDKDEMNPMEWLRFVKEYDRNPSTNQFIFYLFGEAQKWWMSMIRILDGISHGKNLKNSSEINGLGIQKWRKCIQFNMS
jgi:hypothetical protein